MAGETRLDMSASPAWTVGEGSPPGRYRVVVQTPGRIPWFTEVDLTGGDNRLEVPDLPRGVPVELQIHCSKHRPLGVSIANGNLELRDADGDVVFTERFFGHFDDIDTRLVRRSLSLQPGTYRLKVEEVGKTAATAFTVAPGDPGDPEANPKVVVVHIE
jgi:hypothetical protein